MQGLKIVDYEADMLEEMMQLFYNTVHTVNARDYNKEQLDGWAPENDDKRFWHDRLKTRVCKVAFINKQIVGFAELVEVGHVDTLYVHKDFQRQKIAESLLQELLLVARQRNCKVLTTESSITAKPFFETYGFKVTRIKKKLYNGKDFTNYKMTKEL